MTGLIRRWVTTAVVGVFGAGASIAHPHGAISARAGDDPPDSASAQAFLSAVRGVSDPVCQVLGVALRNSYSAGAGSRALGYHQDGVPAGGPAEWALGSMHTPDAIPVLAAGLRDQDGCVRTVSARLLAKTRLDSSRAVLARAASDGDAGIRALAVAALGDLPDSLAVTPLLAALRDEAAPVREAAADALGSFRSRNWRFDMESSVSVETPMAYAYDYNYSVALPALAPRAEAYAKPVPPPAMLAPAAPAPSAIIAPTPAAPVAPPAPAAPVAIP